MNKQGLKLCNQLGTGSYGTVYMAIRAESVNDLLCVKIPINLKSKGKATPYGSFKKEIEYLKSIHSSENQKAFGDELDSIIKPIMKEVMLFGNEPVLVTKRYSFTLLDLIHNKKIELSDMQWSYFTKRLLKAVSFLHRKRIFHRDLKPDNIMVDVKEDEGNTKYSPIIIDFGFVNEPVGQSGTPGYVAPEVLGAKHTKNTPPTKAMMDIFALGSILYEVKYKQRLPRFDKRPKEYEQKVKIIRLANDPMSNLIHGLLDDLPFRFSIEKALKQPWLNPSVK